MDRLVTSVPALSEGHPGNAKPSNDTKLQPLHPASPLRNGEIGFGTISPIENGSFAFDRVIKTGKVHRRIKHKRVSFYSILHMVSSIITSWIGIQSYMEIRTPCPSTKSPLSLQR